MVAGLHRRREMRAPPSELLPSNRRRNARQSASFTGLVDLRAARCVRLPGCTSASMMDSTALASVGYDRINSRLELSMLQLPPPQSRPPQASRQTSRSPKRATPAQAREIASRQTSRAHRMQSAEGSLELESLDIPNDSLRRPDTMVQQRYHSAYANPHSKPTVWLSHLALALTSTRYGQYLPPYRHPAHLLSPSFNQVLRAVDYRRRRQCTSLVSFPRLGRARVNVLSGGRGARRGSCEHR